jgi:ribose transport system permease protein
VLTTEQHAAAPATAQRRRGPRPRVRPDVLYGMAPVVLLVGLIVVFSILKPDRFPTTTNFEAILDNASVTTVLAVGLTLPLAMGDFDLSIGFLASLVGIATASLLSSKGWATGPALLAAAAMGVIVGIGNGVLATKFRLSAFIATLAMGSVLGGVTFAISGGTNVYQNLPHSFTKLGDPTSLGISMPVIIAAGFSAIAWFILSATRTGRSIYAIGSNPEVARFAGIKVSVYRCAGFVAASLGAATAGVLLTARSSAAYVQAGDNFLIPAYAAAFIGAATFKPGLFQVPGTIVGVLLTAVLFSGMTMLGVQSYVQQIITGLILMLAIGIAARADRRKA